MNEKIRELAQIAQKYIDDNKYEYDIVAYHHELAFRDKFAELIIQECLNQCIHVENECRENREHKAESSATLIKLLIKQHFGVE